MFLVEKIICVKFYRYDGGLSFLFNKRSSWDEVEENYRICCKLYSWWVIEVEFGFGFEFFLLIKDSNRGRERDFNWGD